MQILKIHSQSSAYNGVARKHFDVHGMHFILVDAFPFVSGPSTMGDTSYRLASRPQCDLCMIQILSHTIGF
jgi:hypothetical protein